MKITFDSAALAQQLAAASRVINAKNTMPILGCFLVEVQPATEGWQLAITAADAENTLRVTCPLVGFEPDEDPARNRFCLPSKLIMDALKEIPSQPVTLTINMETMEIRGTYASGTFAIVGERADEYPAPPALDGDAQTIVIAPRMLLENINATLFAVADDEIRPVMTGIFFDATPETLTCVGTDGRKLVRRRTAGSADLELPAAPASFIMSKKTALVLRTLPAKADDAVTLRFTDKQAVAEQIGFTLTARLIDGRYPNYNSVIPQNNPYIAELDSSLLTPALRRIMTFADRDSALVRMQFSADELSVSAQDLNFSTSAKETVPATWDGPADFIIGVKGSILLEMLQNLPDNIRVNLASRDRALVFVPAEQSEGVEVLMLLMPMMLND